VEKTIRCCDICGRQKTKRLRIVVDEADGCGLESEVTHVNEAKDMCERCIARLLRFITQAGVDGARDGRTRPE